MAYTTEDRLRKLVKIKTDIKSAIITNGVEVPVDTTFAEYANLINLISDVQDTTTLEDLMLISDYINEIYEGTYSLHNYTKEEQTELENLVTKIIGGE